MRAHFRKLYSWSFITILICSYMESIISQSYPSNYWPPGYYGYNRDYPTGSSQTVQSGLIRVGDPASRDLYGYGFGGQNPSIYGSRYGLPANYYSAPFSSNFGSQSYPPRYSMSSYPYSEFWRYYSQYPSRNQFNSYSPGLASRYSMPNSAYNMGYSGSGLYTNSYQVPYGNMGNGYPYQGTPREITSNPPYYHGLGGPPVGMIGYPAYSDYNRPPNPSNYPSSAYENYPVQTGAYPPIPSSPYSPTTMGLGPESGPWNDYSRRIGWLGTIPTYSDMTPPYGGPLNDPFNRPVLKSVRAVAELRGPGAALGTVIFRQVGNQPVSINGKISGLTPGPHGMHILEMPILGNDCLSAGEHYNPQKTEHGGKHDWNRHVGDLGNIFADSSGVATFDITDLLISLSGGYSVINRTLVITEKADDLGRGTDMGSKRDGNSGSPVACGIIRSSGI